MKKEEKEIRCSHGRKVWGNFGDGMIRHFADDDKTPRMEFCTDPEIYKHPGWMN